MPIDRRSAFGRRLRDLADILSDELGGWASLSEMQAVQVRTAAELLCIAEQARAEALAEGRADPEGLVRLQRAAALAMRQLGLGPDRRREPENGPGQAALLQYAKSRKAGP
jgi:HEAT repeat protein